MDPKLMLEPSDTFPRRHIGPTEAEAGAMLESLGYDNLDALLEDAVPGAIRTDRPLTLDPPLGEQAQLAQLREMAEKNEVFRSLIGMGYYNTITPPVIQRNILENPGWYTQYTPYQAEIAQGRLEALLNFQTMVADLTGLPLANASLLDEATAAAEAMTMARRVLRTKKSGFFVAENCHPQTIAVIQTRAEPLGIQVHVGPVTEIDCERQELFGVLLQYPATDGAIEDYAAVVEQVHAAKGLVVCATDLLALTMLKAPGEFGMDIAVGSAQRFGVPLGYGGPHAAFFATHEQYIRQVPGRIIGVSKDREGRVAYRMAVQTREQHIRREKATSNICTAQVLLAIMAGMYAVYHGPTGLRRIAARVHILTALLAKGLRQLGYTIEHERFFDTLRVRRDEPFADELRKRALAARINLRYYEDGSVGLSLDETSTKGLVNELLALFGGGKASFNVDTLFETSECPAADGFARESAFMSHEVFHSCHSEHDLLRYIHKLQGRDLSLTTSMIPLGSCTMKLNATAEMMPISWPEFGQLHPFAPVEQAQGYQELFRTLEARLNEITGFAQTSLQPNSGASGEHAGLMVIRAYQRARGQGHRDVCLIPVSAHGTNPASAVMAGCRVVPIECDEHGNISVEDLRAKAEKHADQLAALMITYPSTHGVFEQSVRDVCAIVHEHGGQVYMDGANMNAQVGVCRPAEIGADVVHLNLHKTFCIPHGGGGPGMGPISVAAHLGPFLPSHPVVKCGGEQSFGTIAAAPWGSASILPISWMYIALMGAEGLTQATKIAILNANYMAHRLKEHFPVLYTGARGRVAHEFIIDLREFHKSAGIDPDDVAKRLMDFGFHAPTMSWPVAGTLMIEPTESESKAELDRFCEALIAIRGEIAAIERGEADREDNPLKHAPHPAHVVSADEWRHRYSREQAAYPLAWVRDNKFWPAVSRVDNVWGDRHLFCSCPTVESFADVEEAPKLEEAQA